MTAFALVVLFAFLDGFSLWGGMARADGSRPSPPATIKET
jgi:hypothetical protein